MLKRKIFLCLSVLAGTIAELYGQDIFTAVRQGDLKRIEFLVKINPDTVNTLNESGFTPLVIAGYHNQIPVVEFLLAHGAAVNAESPEGPVILGTCYKGNIELTGLLIKYKANVNAQNGQGTSALMYAVLSGKIDLVKLLLLNGAKKDMVEKSGKKALDYAKANGLENIVALLTE